VKRFTLYGIIIIVLGTLIYAGWRGAAWVLGTEDGIRWVLESVSRYTPVGISAAGVEGRLLDRFRLSGVRLTLKDFEAEVSRVDCAWSLYRLVLGTVAVDELTMQGVNLKGPAKTEGGLEWPKVSGVASLFDFSIKKFKVDNLSYTARSGDLRWADMSLQASVLWCHGDLTLRDMVFSSPYGRLRGAITAGFTRPVLKVDLALVSPEAFLGMDTFSARGRFKPGHHDEQIAGDFVVTGCAKDVKLAELNGKAAMTAKAFHFKELHLKIPGREGRITAEGTVTPGSEESLLAFQFLLEGINIRDDLALAGGVSGSVALRGSPSRYKGSFSIKNGRPGRSNVRLSGNYSGGTKDVKIDHLHASLFSGTVDGALSLNWQRGFFVEGLLHGRNLNPEDFHPDIAGVMNFDLNGTLRWMPDGFSRGSVHARLLESRLQGFPVAGEIKAGFTPDEVRLERLSLNGKGFDITASGILQEKLTFDARVVDLGRLLAGAAGQLKLAGWMRHREGRFSGKAAGRGTDLSFHGLHIKTSDLSGSLGLQRDVPIDVYACLKDASYKNVPVDSVCLTIKGDLPRHAIDMELKRKKIETGISVLGRWDKGAWQGSIERFSGRDGVGPWSLAGRAFVTAAAGNLVLTPLVLFGDGSERLQIQGTLTKKWTEGFFAADWSRVKIARLGFPAAVRGAGFISGKMEGKMHPDGQISLMGEASVNDGKVNWQGKKQSLEMFVPDAEFTWSREENTDKPAAYRLTGRTVINGRFVTDKGRITVKNSSFSIKGTERGINVETRLSLIGGFVKASFSSSEPLAFGLPQSGKIDARWADIDAALLCFLMPETGRIEGLLSGNANGSLLPGRQLSLKGKALLSPRAGAGEGTISLKKTGGETNLNFHLASSSWDWNEKGFSGDVSVDLGGTGRLTGNFRLPVSAGIPLCVDKTGPVYLSLKAGLKENGILTYLFPGAIKESHGDINADVVVEGSWVRPFVSGRMKLTDAGAYLPSAGIDLSQVEVLLTLDGNRVRIDSFRARSGPGIVEGNAVIKLDGRRVASFDGSITGKDFQLVYLPELQARCAPKLTFNGTPKKIAVRGDVKITKLLLFGPPAGNYITPSPDVVFAGSIKKNLKSVLPLFDAKLRVTIGDHALVKMKGLEAKLAGGVQLDFQSIDKIAGSGEIRTVSGSYKAYGVDLKIGRGRLFYRGGPIDQPALDILAFRSAAGVKAGVTIGGVLNAPIIKLYSEPVMSDVDILAYIVFGHPLANRSSAEQIGTLAQAAGLLLSGGKAMAIQEKLKETFGLSALDIESKSTGGGGVGYNKINTDLASSKGASNQANGVPDTLISVGKYLTPQLYLSYGKSLFSGNDIFSLRYDIGKKWQIETVTGTESGIDLYYKIDFR